MAANSGYDDTVDTLFKFGADLNPTDREGYSAIHMAAMNGHLGIIRLVHEHLIDDKAATDFIFNAVTGNGHTPFHWACSNGHDEVAKYLVDVVKVDILKKDGKNRTALTFAQQKGHKSIVSWLSPLMKFQNEHDSVKTGWAE